MRRRDLIAVAALAAWPFELCAQPAMPVIGFLNIGTPEGRERFMAAFHKGLAEAGFIEGKNLAIEYRWARGNYAALPALVADLVRRKVAVIVTGSNEVPALSAKGATSTIPIVAMVAGDPVKLGLVASMNRPGGNLTAVGLFSASSNALVAKRLQIIHGLVPQAKTVGWLPDSNIGDYQDELDDVRAGARTLGLDIEVANVATDADLEPAIVSLVDRGVGAILEGGPIFTTNRTRLVALALHYAVPWIFENRDFVTDGGLMSYGTDTSEAFRQVGAYAGRILNGEKPGDLPVVRPIRFELFINLKTAKALGLTMPPTLLAVADKVIE